MSSGHDPRHGHGHGHGHGLSALEAVNAGARYKRPLTIAFLLTVAFAGMEFRGRHPVRSLALLHDAGHMLSDGGGLGMSLAAISLANAVLLFAVAAPTVNTVSLARHFRTGC